MPAAERVGEYEAAKAGAERRTLLIVDDDTVLRTRLVRAFTERGYEAAGADCAEQALALARTDAPEYALVDLRLEQGSGLELLRELLAIEPAMHVVMLTGYGSIATALEAVRTGAVHYLTKPALIEEIIAALEGNVAPHAADGTHGDDPAVPSLERVEWEHIQRVLHDCGGNITHAARLLGLHRRSLQRKLAKFAPEN